MHFGTMKKNHKQGHPWGNAQQRDRKHSFLRENPLSMPIITVEEQSIETHYTDRSDCIANHRVFKNVIPRDLQTLNVSYDWVVSFRISGLIFRLL
jgi:hypothetical protein